MNDETKAQIAALKRKKAALEQAGAVAKVFELQAVIAGLEAEKEEPFPSGPKAYPNPTKPAELQPNFPEKATPKPQTRRATGK